MCFWKLHETTVGGVTTSYVTVIDTSNAGVQRSFNYNNLIENNLIYDVGRAGIFMGNDENSIIRGNRIHSISGDVVDENGIPVEIDCAGILLGGRQRSPQTAVDGFMVIGTEVYKNEISNIISSKSISGIKLEQSMVLDGITATFIRFPDSYERIKIYSNIV
jgi:parallel beta-helix repeat protein